MNIIVDAELYDGKNNIVQNILVSLFAAYTKEINSNQSIFHNNYNAETIKLQILEKFEIIFNDLNYILLYGNNKNFKSDCMSNHPLETLSGMGSSCNLKEHILELKKLLETGFKDIVLCIENYNRCKVEALNDYYLMKYIDNCFIYRLI